MERWVLPRPDDFHVHLRQDADLPAYARRAARSFGRILGMPNLVPPVRTGADVEAYRRAILEAAPGLVPLVAFKLGPDLTDSDLQALSASGSTAGKVYPEGVTTTSEGGLSDLRQIVPLLPRVGELGFVVCCHGEKPGVFSLDREEAFLDEFSEVAAAHPGVRFVLEHISTEAAAKRVRELGPNVAATITLHHLEITLDDVVGGHLKPHLFCKPLAKRASDRQALREAAFSASPRFFFGSDSAPHRRDRKECAAGCAGVYSMPVALERLAGIFDEEGRRDRRADFVAGFGADFYRLPRSTDSVTLERDPWTVPDLLDGAVPYLAGETLEWRVAGAA